MQEERSTVELFEAAFAEAVRESRQELGWSQRRLADALGERGIRLDPTAITRLETGRRRTGLGEAAIIADILEIDIADLVFELQPTHKRLQNARDEANKSMHDARKSLCDMAWAFSQVDRLLRDHPDLLPTVSDHEYSSPKVPDDYLKWVGKRMGRISRKGWRETFEAEEPYQRDDLQGLVDLVAHDVVRLPGEGVDADDSGPAPDVF
ncbi:helix-turn-helix domain-containing protein [Nocardia sp. CY41]|uniref:helix-turn-helix domain-containing protein n=1 Tax=Nocardia sp. CY41 TaxID=2608686 RepID=UPI001359BABC|nr:helix-turn-helix transcriptional regulator [Nocardia sp. CY41]